jgi:hypothetical protein
MPISVHLWQKTWLVTRRALVDHAAFHHKDNAPHGSNILQRIAVKRNYVSL